MSTPGWSGFAFGMGNKLAASERSSLSLESDVPVEEKVKFLSRPGAFAHTLASVEIIETHMSWVFLADALVYKLKKPVRYSFLDFTTLAAREANCREEMRLNRRLAPDTYVGVMPLARDSKGALALGGAGEIVDWLVVMRRLPANRMLDRVLTEKRVGADDLERLAEVLARFYQAAEPSTISAETYADRFVMQQAENRSVLTRREFRVGDGRIFSLLDTLEERLQSDRGLLEDRALNGRILEGHGDLRPEHICLTEPIAIFDCLEFSRDLRLVDPFDELTFLGMECRILGAPSVGPTLIEQLATRLGDSPSDRLLGLYTAFRAVLRARLSLAHLLDPFPREPTKWEPLASRYLALAEQALH